MSAFDDRVSSMRVCPNNDQAKCGPGATAPPPSSGGGGSPPPSGGGSQPSSPPPSQGPPPPPAQDPRPAEPDPAAPPPAPPAPTCAGSQLQIGPLTARATCFRRDGDSFVAGGQVRIGGMDLLAGPGGQVRLNTRSLEVSASGPVQLKVGSFVLYKRAFTWKLGGTFTFDVERGVKLRGLPLTGKAALSLDGATRTLKVALTVSLPSVLGGVTGDTSIRVAPDGVAVADVKVTAGSARLGRFELRDLSLAYASPSRGVHHFDGAATIVLPAPASPTVAAGLGFGVGDSYFRVAGSVNGLNKPLSTGVFLQRIRFEVQVNPIKLSGGLGLSAGPRVLGKEAVSIDGDFTYEQGPPDKYTVSGSGKLVDVEVGSGTMTYQTDGKLDISAKVKIERYGIGFSGEITGWVDGSRAFNVQGSGSAKLGPATQGAEAVVSSVGIAACRRGFGPDVGFGYAWGRDPEIFASSCGIGPWIAQRPGGARAAQAGRFATFGIAPGTDVAAFSAVGVDRPPRIRVEGPRGEVIATTPADPAAAVDDGRVLLFQHPESKTTYAAVKGAAAGTYKLVLENDSAPATVLRAASSLPAPVVRAFVRGRGRDRRLSWSLRPQRGQRVTFYEQGPDTRRRLVVTRARRGRIRFTVPDGRPGRRQIVAEVSQDGRRLLFLPGRNERTVIVPGARPGLRANVTVRGLTSTGRRGPRGRDSTRAPR
ncbi:MAG: hypothetical protein AVDCRST_MAG85-883 [uncultured Solirubrobacteraceae bacterium]|uniref:Uncharacterized protein n=1 Tax=uncultured Solirubrobacteraceae bacterium TaxID=1162706 RepID=A0A6J4S462_9ACTN|nr:MAG: hypothetical protein AVDCRST_MAG85-883 [uncultured Solirubrobacteraceae bacterium]